MRAGVVGPKFVCVSGPGVPPESSQLLVDACRGRGIRCEIVMPERFTFDPAQRLGPGDMLYCASASAGAAVVEQFLSSEQVATFYRDHRRVVFDCVNPRLWLDQSGIPVPDALPCLSADRDAIRSSVARLGGLPVVVKLGGGQAGIGTILVDSFAGLFSLLDFALTQDATPHLLRFIAGAEHWRVVVVGDLAVAAYPNAIEPGDFRTRPRAGRSAYTTTPPSPLGDLAVAATKALGLEFGGADLLLCEGGAVYVLEVNMPCYYAQAQLVGGIDVAGAMVDHLLAKSRRLGGTRNEPAHA